MPRFRGRKNKANLPAFGWELNHESSVENLDSRFRGNDSAGI